jgi:hypothetical protein
MTFRREDNAAGSCLFHPAAAKPILVATVLMAGYLAEKFVDPCADMRMANTDFTQAAELLSADTDLSELVCRVRRRVSSLWPEIVRLAEALDRDGELVGVDLIKSIVRLPSWL